MDDLQKAATIFAQGCGSPKLENLNKHKFISGGMWYREFVKAKIAEIRATNEASGLDDKFKAAFQLALDEVLEILV